MWSKINHECNFSLASLALIDKRDLNMFMDVLTLDFLKQYGEQQYDYVDYAAKDEQDDSESKQKEYQFDK